MTLLPTQAVDVILRDGATLRLRPPGREDSGPLLASFRDLSERSLRLSRPLGDDLSDVAELDLNPVLADAAGCAAVDARVRVARADATARVKTW